MVSIDQIQKAAVRFLDSEIAGAFSGWDKTLVCGTGALFIHKIPKMVAMYESHPAFQAAAAVGAYDAANKMVDIDLLYQTYKPWFSDQKITINIPVVNQSIKIGREEIEKFVLYIKEA